MKKISLLLLALSYVSGQAFAQDAEVKAKLSASDWKTKFPIQDSRRPFTLPQGVIGATIGFSLKDTKDKVMNLNTSAKAGITDKLELALAWGGLNFNAFNASKDLTIGFNYFTFAAGPVANMVGISAPLDFGRDQVLRTLHVHAPLAFSIIPNKMGISVFGDDFMVLQVRPDAGFSMAVPVRYSVQVGDHFNFSASTHLATANFKMKDDAGKLKSHTTIWSKPEITLGALFAINEYCDLTLSTGFSNLRKPLETFTVGVGFAVRAGIV